MYVLWNFWQAQRPHKNDDRKNLSIYRMYLAPIISVSLMKKKEQSFRIEKQNNNKIEVTFKINILKSRIKKKID